MNDDGTVNSLKKHYYVQYTSPEIYTNHGRIEYSVDYWSLGIIIFKMLTGSFPFKTIEKVTNNHIDDHPKWKSLKSIELKQLVKSLLEKDQFKRLGSLKNAKKIKQDPFFATINWDKLERGQLEPPFKPIVVKFFIF